jgi:hypothetical protein
LSGGHVQLLGYSTQPEYDECIRTVYVPIFQNRTMRRGLEFEVTRAVIREIEAKTPYKVVSNPDQADTELCGTIVSVTKNMLNRNQLNEVREAEMVLGAEVVWKNLRTGESLSQPKSTQEQPHVAPTLGDVGGTLDAAVSAAPGPPTPHLVTARGGFIPELGGSITTGYQELANRLAIQIVSMMEKTW